MWNFITSGKSHTQSGIGGPSKQQCVVFRRQYTVIGGKCALSSALLVDYEFDFFSVELGHLVLNCPAKVCAIFQEVVT